MIESGHKHVLQARIKKAGAWWTELNAHALCQLCTLRANLQWNNYREKTDFTFSYTPPKAAIVMKIAIVILIGHILVVPCSAATESFEAEPRIVALWPDPREGAGGEILGPTLQIFLPFEPRAAGSATILICPGGGYSKHGAYYRMFADFFRSQGHAAAIVNYRLPPVRHPGAYADVARAMRLLRARGAEWNLSQRKIALMGGSAGGHVAALVATRPDYYKEAADDLAATVSARPDRLILAYPVISAIAPYSHRSLLNYLGPAPSRALREEVSPEKHIGLHVPPTFLLHAADDANVVVANSIDFAQACWAAGVPAELHVFPRGGHGPTFTFAAGIEARWRELLAAWLQEWARTP